MSIVEALGLRVEEKPTSLLHIIGKHYTRIDELL